MSRTVLVRRLGARKVEGSCAGRVKASSCKAGWLKVQV
jgi:hypothetical protein